MKKIIKKVKNISHFKIILIFIINIFWFCQSMSPPPMFGLYDLPDLSNSSCFNSSFSSRLSPDFLWGEQFITLEDCMEEKTFTGRNANVTKPPADAYLLPTTIQPLRYFVKLCPVLQKPFNFTGSVLIRIKAKKPTNEIVLNAKEIKVHSPTLKVYESRKREDKNSPSKPKSRFRRSMIGSKDLQNSSSAKVKSKRQSASTEEWRSIPVNITRIDEELEKVFIKSEEILQIEKTYMLRMEFRGNATDPDKSGLYAAAHHSDSKTKKYSLGTQFQFPDARKMFPCFDEPQFRAKFTLVLCREKSFTALSNMPKSSTFPKKDAKNYVWDRFEPTPPIPTYMFALAVLDDYEFVECKSSLKLPIRVWTPSSALNLSGFACKMVPPLLKYLEDYLNVSHSLQKLDLLAFYDYKYWAMENWGLNTFKISKLLINETDPGSTKAMSDVMYIISHEIAHQWFGNIVTPFNWSYTWLSEGITDHFSMLGSKYLFPEKQILETRFIKYIRDLMGFCVPRPMVPSFHTREDERLVVKDANGKGSFLTRMISHSLSEKVFKLGIKNYLTNMKYKSVTQDDLANSLTQAAHEAEVLPKNVTMNEILLSWTHQGDYPIVNASRFPNGTLALTQNIFKPRPETTNLKGRGEISPAPNPGKWWIPLSMATKNNPTFNDTFPKYWMNSSSHWWHVKELSQRNNWYVLNVQRTCILRANYDAENWQALIKQLRDNHEVIDQFTRAQLIDDAYFLAISNTISFDIYYGLISYIKKETSWFVIFNVLSFMQYNIYGDNLNIFLPLLAPHYPKDGIINRRKDVLPYIRSIEDAIIKIICYVYEPCIKEASFIYNQWKENISKPVVNEFLLNVIIRSAKPYSEPQQWARMHKEFESVTNVATKKRLLPFLARTKNVANLHELLNMLSANSPRLLAEGLNQIAANPETTQIAWDYFQQTWPKVTGTPDEMDLFLAVVPHLRTKTQHEELENLVNEKMGSSSISKFLAKKMASKVGFNIEVKNRQLAGLRSWTEKGGTFLDV